MASLDHVLQRAEQMIAHRRSYWDAHFEAIRDVIHPRTPSFIEQESHGNRRRTEILDNSAEVASEVFAAALHGLLTNPSQNWFALRAMAAPLNERDDVRRWLSAATEALLTVFRSPATQFGTQVAVTYRVLGDFGTAGLYIQDRPGRLPLFTAVPLAQLHIDEGPEGTVDTVYRVWRWTARQAFARWGAAAGPKVAEAAADPKKAGQEFRFLHAVMPAPERGMGRLDAAGLPVASIYANMDEQHLIDEGGFHEMPFVVPRWFVSVGERYGRGPGMKALPDVRTLQREMRSTLRAAEKAIEPPLLVADDGVIQPLRTGAGAINYVRAELLGMRQAPVQPMPTGARPDIGEEFAEQIRGRIRESYFLPMLQISRDPRMTATQVLKIDEEQQRILGPAIGRLQTEMLGPIIGRVYGLLDRAGMLPPAPADLARTGLEVEYVSPLVKAQRLSEVSATAQWFDMMLPLAQVNPQVFDIADTDGAMRAIAERLNVPVAAVRSAEAVAAIRQTRAEMERQQQMAEQAMQGAAALQSVAQASQTMNGDNNQRRAA